MVQEKNWGWKPDSVGTITLISCLDASDKYALTDGDNRSEYFGDAGRSTSGLRELAPSSMLSPVLLCCRQHFMLFCVKAIRINMVQWKQSRFMTKSR